MVGIKKMVEVEGLHYLKRKSKDGIVLVGVHFLILELAHASLVYIIQALVFIVQMITFVDWLQTQGRLRSNKDV